MFKVSYVVIFKMSNVRNFKIHCFFKISKFQCVCLLKFQIYKTNRNISTKISNFPQLHNFDNKSKHQNKHIKNN